MKFIGEFGKMRMWFPSPLERDGRVRSDADKIIAEEILKTLKGL
jgi:hypothetical protein